MNRFFGMMPSSEIEIKKRYVDKSNLDVTIEAGKNGWTILWADGGSTYKDEVHTAQENFDIAYKIAVESVGDLTERTSRSYCVSESASNAVSESCFVETAAEECYEEVIVEE